MSKTTVPMTKSLGDWLGLQMFTSNIHIRNWIVEQLDGRFDDEFDLEAPLTLQVPQTFESITRAAGEGSNAPV